MNKKVTEEYVVDAMSHTAAEERITDEMKTFVSGEFDVKSIVPAPFREIFFSDDTEDDKWYQVKLDFISFDENTDKEKRSKVTYLVQAGSVNRAVKNVDEVMGGTMIDYEIVSVNSTKFWDVFEYKKNTEDVVDGKMKAAGE